MNPKPPAAPKTVLITGTSSGFGRTTARYFANLGWNVAATMRRPDAETELNELPNVLVTRLDVQDNASIAAAIEACISRFGSIDVLVNNAGYGLFGAFETISPARVRDQFEVNVFGAMETIRAILPHFRARRAGVIVNIGSGAGIFGLPASSLYCASKFALEGFTEALSYELSSLGIRVKMLEPGGVLSTRFGQRTGSEATGNATIADYDAFNAHTAEVFARLRQARRTATEEDVARVIYEAATDASSRLRYLPTPDIVPWVNARRETNEENYLRTMRSAFGYEG